MAWILKNQRRIRWTILVLLVVAILGPWGFDRIHVPAEYPCNLPFIRLEGDFCGLPISGIRNLGWMFGGLLDFLLRWFTGEIDLNQAFRVIGFILAVILLLLPIFNVLLIQIRGTRPHIQKFHLVICALDFGLLLALGLANYPKFFYALWGVWLYIGLLLSTLILEGIWQKAHAADARLE